MMKHKAFSKLAMAALSWRGVRGQTMEMLLANTEVVKNSITG